MSIDINTPQSQPVVPKTWDRRVARWVSNVTNPAIPAVIAPLLVAQRLDTPAAWYWTGSEIVSLVVIPLFFLLWMLRKGKIGDFEIYQRRQRNAPYIFINFLLAAFVVVMWLASAPPLLLLLAITSLAQNVVMFLVNMRWKISAHSVGITDFCVVLWYLAGRAAIPFLVLVPLVVWSRVRLHRHTLPQTLVGVAFAATSLGIVLGLFL